MEHHAYRQQIWPVAQWLFLGPRHNFLFYYGHVVPCSRSDNPADFVPLWWQQLKTLKRSQPEGREDRSEILLVPDQTMFPKIHE